MRNDVKKLVAIETQIKKKQETLFELKDKMDAVMVEIEDLLKQKEALQKEELLKEMSRSNRTYDGIIALLKSAPNRNIESKPNSKVGRPRKQ